MPNGLSVASGLASGASAFTQAFHQARLQKFQMKEQKNDRLAQILLAQIQDPNTTFHERASILNEYQKLYDPKPERRLSTILGYDKLNEKDFIVEEGAKEIKGKPGASLSSEETGSPNAGQTLQMRGTESAAGVADITEKYGDLTPARVHLKLQKDLEKAKDSSDIDKQVRILKANYTLQADILNKNGFKQEVSRGLNNNGEFEVIYTNGKDIKTINLGKHEPSIITKAKISASGKGAGGKLGQLIHMRSIIEAYNNDPTSVSPAQYKGAADFLDEFERNGRFVEAKTEGVAQGNLGIKKIQPAQSEDDKRARNKDLAAYRAAANSAKRQTIEAGNDAGTKAEQAKQFWVKTIQPIKDKINAFFTGKGLDPNNPGASGDTDYLEEPTFKGLSSELEKQTAIYERMNSAAGDAASKYKSLLGTQQEAEDILNEYSSGDTSSTNNKTSNFSNTQKAMIAVIRKANGAAAANLSDEQIAAQIMADPVRSKKFK